ncbi:MAG: enoyl-CoA hydratase/isomerase family protein [Gemmatimonadota bacterium]
MTPEMTLSQVRLQVDAESGVARITLDNPDRRNALSRLMVAELSGALARADADPAARVVLLDANGPDFCAGADLREVQASVEEGVLASLTDAEALGNLFIQIRRMDKPVVSAVHGRALAGGCGLATACDMVLAAADAEFGYPEVRLGFVPAMVIAILRRSVGEKRAFELVALGNSIGAARALAIGLVNKAFESDGFELEALETARELAARSASALSLTKRLLYQVEGASFEDAIRAGAEVNALARLTPDCQAGIKRFLDR